MLTVLGKHNPRVKALLRLAQKKGREKAGEFLVEGPHLVAEALRHGKVRALYLTPEFASSPEGEELIRKAEARKVEVFGLAPQLLARAADTATPQGVLAVVEMPSASLPSLLQVELPLLVIVDGLQDPGNLGTIVRTAQAVAATGVVVLKGSVDPFHPRAVRATAGAIFRLPVVKGPSAEEVLPLLRTAGIELVVADPRGEVPFYAHSFLGPTALVIGSEGGGPGPVWSTLARRVYIPMPGKTESLNAAVAAALLLYEAARQRYRWR
ncbi:tRNA/rRNA methyltransferase (SpoU) [Ammonifex degensii KC4]|uniref:tRNA/rRNA methyltransferase (SpoU) n=1 Tax=Ammonifex degensii (strain DSM 10501 / KC4) TaxID=429009 RepID=C9RBQ9_AMMDK|nr:RNA methyltransferase [Ammonifex degensii]ACX51686.1 tRNA/rRNA methyltransferase (SpoU) [Ammonifex degensii KC4]